MAQWRVKWHASKMTRQANCLASRVYLVIMKSRIEAKYCMLLIISNEVQAMHLIQRRFSIIKLQKCGRE